MTDTPPAAPPEAAPPLADREVYLNRMRRAAYGVVLFVLSIHLLEKFRDVLQPFFIALFITFMMQPVHRWLVGRGISSLLAYIVIVCLVMLALFGIGIMIYDNLTSVATKLPEYEDRFDKMLRSGIERLPPQFPQLRIRPVREMFSSEELMSWARTALGGFRDFSSWAALTFIYLLFLVAEKVSFPRRIVLAFGAEHGAHLKTVGESIHAAIGQYIAVKTLVSALAGLLSYAVMAAFGVEFAATWGVLIFLLNYIPYLGSMIAVALPILLSFLQFDEV